MKHFFPLFFALTFFISGHIFPQNLQSYSAQKDKIEQKLNSYGELYFRFSTNSKDIINELGKQISIDNVINRVFYFEVYAYANAEEMEYFSKKNIDFELLKNPGDNGSIKTSDNIEEITAWDVYPTYSAYVSMMNNFATAYPNLCKIYNAGATIQGRQILFAVISDSVNFRKPKPRFMYSSSIHGDETTGYVLMLRLIDTLLSGYGNNAILTNLVKNCEIWINPLANPDGTYHGGDNTVTGAWRYNANSKDINRNFPDPVGGPNPTGEWQPETIVMMNLFKKYNFTLSMNFHGGAEVFNYPWDCKSQLHPDDAWFINLGRRYVDTVHRYSPSTYLDDNLGYPNIPGVVNGYAWYSVYGGRQDYMTYFNGGREVTLEISSTKMVAQANLPTYWGYNHRSFIYYIKETLNGVRGIVTDSISGLPIKAKIYTIGQNDSTWIYSDSTCGDYHRMLAAGSYSLLFKAPGYYDKIISGIQVYTDSAVTYNVKMRSSVTSVGGNESHARNYELFQNYPNPFNPETNISFSIPKNEFVTLAVYDITGKEISLIASGNFEAGRHTINWNAEGIPSGIYFCKIQAGQYSSVRRMMLVK